MRRLCFALCLALAATVRGGAQEALPAATFAEPTVSPDHAEIAFLSGGDIWSVPSAGGIARLLAGVGGMAERPLFSPDGKRLAFVSRLGGNAGVEVLDLDGGHLQRITYDDTPPTLDGWSRDGRFLYLSSADKTIAYQTTIVGVPATGGTPVSVRAEAYVNQMDATPSPNGAELAYVRNGFHQWWRRGHSHIDQSSIEVEHVATHTFDAITNGTSKDRWPMWSADGTTLYFVSDRSGSDELWSARDGKLDRLTTLTPGRIVWPTISRDGTLIAFERNMTIWTYDVATGAMRELAIEPRGLAATVPTVRRTLTRSFGPFDLSPDGNKLAFVAGGRIFATSAAEGGDALLVPSREFAAGDEPVWARDSRRVAYVVDRGDEQAIATYAFPDGPQRTLTPARHHDDYPHWSPDGTKLEFVRDGREIHVIDVTTQADRVIARGTFDRRPFGDEDDVAFSFDGAWLAFVDNPPGGFSNAYVVPVAGGEARAITALPNTNAGPLAWSPEGKRLYVVTSQRTENGAVAQVDLIPRAPRFREDTFRALFDEEPLKPERPSQEQPVPAATAVPKQSTPAPRPKASPPVRIDFAGIDRRVTLLPTGVDVGRVSVTPDGKRLILDATVAGQQNLYSYSVDETASDEPVARQMTSTPGAKARTRIAPDGKSVVYEDAGQFSRISIDGKDPKPIAISAAFDADFERDKRVVFAQVWSTLDRWYADPRFNGVDWAAERHMYEARALAAHTRSEFARILLLMIGELDSSHSGFRSAPLPGAGPTIGHLGADFDPATYERDGTLRFSTLVPLGPLALAGNVKVGDELLTVDGTAVDAHTDVAALLANTIGKRTELRIAPAADAGAARVVVVLPNDDRSDAALRYRAWVAGRRAYVERSSGGRLGYVHLFDMEPEALAKFFTDLDVANREKLGVVIDIRNNEGGFVDPYAIDVLARRDYVRLRSRFGNDPPERTALGQRALERPTVLVTNEHTLSDGENFTEGYRKLHLGQVVGTPTAGWIIFTSDVTLADGSELRVPSTSVFAEDGTNMERHPRGVDIEVDNTPAASERGNDLQLDAAVRALLKRIANAR